MSRIRCDHRAGSARPTEGMDSRPDWSIEVPGQYWVSPVGPNDCEVTGLAWNEDRRTMFVGIRHPGDKGNGHLPEGGNVAPRSAVVAITRDDGGVIG